MLDKTGNTYDNLVVLRYTGRQTKYGKRIWEARCTVIRDGLECGRLIQSDRIGQKDGPKSCGCISRVHGLSKILEYRVWRVIEGWPVGRVSGVPP
jgi:hypothetical protein